MDDKILIENYDTNSDKNLVDLERWFNKESKIQCPNIKKWIRDKGGINPKSKAADVSGLTQKESGYKGRSSLIKKEGKALDVLRDEAEWEGIIDPNVTTDNFGEMIKNSIIF